jgi:hypothetical protein
MTRVLYDWISESTGKVPAPEFFARIRAEAEAIATNAPLITKVADKRAMRKAVQKLGIYYEACQDPPFRLYQYDVEKDRLRALSVPKPWSDTERGTLIWVLNRFLK